MSASAHQERLLQVLIGPHVSEKATTVQGNQNQIVLKVRPNATKNDVRRAVELLFDVNVEHVAVVRMPAKSKRFGARVGRRPAWKKAYVRLAPGQSIDFMGAE
jgi:large subunit ribosomal protein L23